MLTHCFKDKALFMRVILMVMIIPSTMMIKVMIQEEGIHYVENFKNCLFVKFLYSSYFKNDSL